jgi:hypothetical protein
MAHGNGGGVQTLETSDLTSKNVHALHWMRKITSFFKNSRYNPNIATKSIDPPRIIIIFSIKVNTMQQKLLKMEN